MLSKEAKRVEVKLKRVDGTRDKLCVPKDIRVMQVGDDSYDTPASMAPYNPNTSPNPIGSYACWYCEIRGHTHRLCKKREDDERLGKPLQWAHPYTPKTNPTQYQPPNITYSGETVDVDFSSKATLPMPIELVQKSFQMLTQQIKQMTQEMK